MPLERDGSGLGQVAAGFGRMATGPETASFCRQGRMLTSLAVTAAALRTKRACAAHRISGLQLCQAGLASCLCADCQRCAWEALARSAGWSWPGCPQTPLDSRANCHPHPPGRQCTVIARGSDDDAAPIRRGRAGCPGLQRRESSSRRRRRIISGSRMARRFSRIHRFFSITRPSCPGLAFVRAGRAGTPPPLAPGGNSEAWSVA